MKTKKFTSKQGNEYTFQEVLPSVWLEMLDRADGKNALLYPGVLESVVVQPSGLKVDDMSYPELTEVVGAALNFQRGQ